MSLLEREDEKKEFLVLFRVRSFNNSLNIQLPLLGKVLLNKTKQDFNMWPELWKKYSLSYCTN